MINGLTYDEIDAITDFIEKLEEQQKDLDDDIVDMVNKNFWDLI